MIGTARRHARVTMRVGLGFLPALAVALCAVSFAAAQGITGYYRQPALHDDTLVFVSEGDLWKVPADGGVATRLTTHAGEESRPAISPDGTWLAFAAQYEGPTELYTMPLSGGLPIRWTFDAPRISHVGWTPDGRLLAGIDTLSTLPNQQLATIVVQFAARHGVRELLPLAQAADGEYADDGRTLFFTRLPFQGSHTRRYRGGTAQNIWRFADGDVEATPLTADYPGTSRRPMWWGGRVYFASDRSGVMNLWSMKPDGGDLRQHTQHADYEVQGTSLSRGRIAYQLGADLRMYDIASGADRIIPITLESDFDQTRERWVPKPLDYLSAAHVAPDGARVALTARGQVFVAPHRQGRLVEASRKPGVRYRDAQFSSDGKSLLALSDESGEIELWRMPANGVGEAERLTRDGDVLRWGFAPSPDGRRVAHFDKNQRLFVLDLETRENRKIDESPLDDFGDLSWSPDGRWLAYTKSAENQFRFIRIYDTVGGTIVDATTDRFSSYSPAWSPDGKWLYFLSDRNLVSVVGSPWGAYQPEPFLDRTTRVYLLALGEGQKSPWAPAMETDEPAKPAGASQPTTSSAPASASAPSSAPASAPGGGEKPRPTVTIAADGLAARLFDVPIPPGNYASLALNEKALFLTSRAAGESKVNLVGVTIARENVELKTIAPDVRGYEISADGKKLLVRKGDAFYVLDAAADEAKLEKKDVDLSGWSISLTPREEWRQMFTEAWRLERDYFYDRGMHGVDWPAMLEKYRPLTERVSTRAELSDAIAQMVAELAALHIFVSGGDLRRGTDDVEVASLGAILLRDADAGGFRIERLYESDPDIPSELGPLAQPDVAARAGDVIVAINGTEALTLRDPHELLRRKAGRQVLLRLKRGDGPPRDVVVTPIGPAAAGDLRYRDWELSRRRLVDEWSGGRIGYVHLRAMGGGNFTEWARNFYPVFTRAGLIVDVRHNRGGNIDSWIIGRLMRKAWFYWSQRVGQAQSWNMQYAFRGHVAVLCNERTASDGEAFTEGVKRLGLARVFGTRTWGGEIWLSSSNFLEDGGIATAAEYGVFGPEGAWLVEGHGVEPDEVVDNLPHATFLGSDAQLRAAVDYLLLRIKDAPPPPVIAPKYPDKSK